MQGFAGLRNPCFFWGKRDPELSVYYEDIYMRAGSIYVRTATLNDEKNILLSGLTPSYK